MSKNLFIAALLQVLVSAFLALPMIVVALVSLTGFWRSAIILWAIISPFITMYITKSIRRAYRALEDAEKSPSRETV